MNISEQATKELQKPVRARDYALIRLDLKRWRDVYEWLASKRRGEIRALLASMDEPTREDYRRRLNVMDKKRKDNAKT